MNCRISSRGRGTATYSSYLTFASGPKPGKTPSLGTSLKRKSSERIFRSLAALLRASRGLRAARTSVDRITFCGSPLASTAFGSRHSASLERRLSSSRPYRPLHERHAGTFPFFFSLPRHGLPLYGLIQRHLTGLL